MTWFRIDDTLPLHVKVVEAGNAAMGLWVRAGAWSAQQLTDGFVPHHIVRVLGQTAEVKRLVDSGLWTPVDGGYQFWQWGERQPSRSAVEARREADVQRKAEARREKARRHGFQSDTS